AAGRDCNERDRIDKAHDYRLGGASRRSAVRSPDRNRVGFFWRQGSLVEKTLPATGAYPERHRADGLRGVGPHHAVDGSVLMSDKHCRLQLASTSQFRPWTSRVLDVMNRAP